MRSEKKTVIFFRMLFLLAFVAIDSVDTDFTLVGVLSCLKSDIDVRLVGRGNAACPLGRRENVFDFVEFLRVDLDEISNRRGFGVGGVDGI